MLEIFPKKAERGDISPPDFLKECISLMGKAWLETKLHGYIDPVSAPDELLSEKTASQLYYLARLERLNPEALGDVVELGAGFGNLALLALRIGRGCTSYTIIDLPDVLPISKSYLKQNLPVALYSRVEFANALDTNTLLRIATRPYDLAVSTFAMTEMPLGMRRWYAANLLSNAASFYVVGQKFFKGESAGGFIEYLRGPYSLNIRPYFYDSIGWATFEISGSASGYRQ